MRKLTGTFALVLMALGLLVSSVGAAVNYTPDAGGFAGKGDVKGALGVSEAQINAQGFAETLNFTYVVNQSFTFDCEWYTGPERNRTRHENSKITEYDVDSNVVTEVRKNSNNIVTGFNLSGIVVGSANEPVDADCGAEGNDMKTIVPGSIEPGPSTGGLYVNGFLILATGN